MTLPLTRTSITHFRDIPSNIHINMDSGWNWNTFQGFSLYEVNSYIKSLEDNKTFMIVPVFTTNLTSDFVAVNLSSPFLIDNRSNPILIMDYLVYQWEHSGLSNKLKIIFLFKLKRVWLIYK
jgi:hypothetical protein